MKICICSSMAFYEKFMVLKKELENAGYTVMTPELEFEAKESEQSIGTFFDRQGGVDAFPADHEIWKKKGKAILAHFEKINESDCILITNYEKKGMSNYIGGNTFMEMGYAYGMGKKIFILNDMPLISAYKEEMLGMQPIILHGDISKITAQ